MNVTRTVLLTLLVGLGFALAGCSYNIEGPGTSSGETYGLNETTTISQGNATFDVTVVDYRFGETAVQAADGGTITPPDGAKYLYVKVSVTNTGSEAAAAPSVDVKPDSNGSMATSFPAWMVDDVYYPIQTMEVNESSSGWNRYLVPADTSASDVKIAISTDLNYFNNEYRWRLD